MFKDFSSLKSNISTNELIMLLVIADQLLKFSAMQLSVTRDMWSVENQYLL